VTRLERFITLKSVKPSHLADHAGMSRQYLLKLRRGTAEPTRPMMVKIAGAARWLLCRRVKVQELFDLGDDTT
jgi:transcriptional regulator with XRE-family HTH domain